MADVELLPLPSPQVPFIDCDPSTTDIRRLVRWYEQGATEYARANVSRATARLQAEIEALRAEVGELHMHAKRRDQYAAEKAAQTLAWKTRAERLAEALRKLEEREQSDETLLRQALEALERGAWDTLSGRNAAFAIRERLGLLQEE